MSQVAVFIDGGYARKVNDAFPNNDICYRKFSDHVAGADIRVRTYYYDCPPYISRRPTQEERQRQRGFDRFKTTLQRLPRFQVRLGWLQRFTLPGGDVEYRQKAVDILLMLDLVRLSASRQIQRAVLLAKDSDFVPAIDIAKDEGVIVQLYYSNPRPNMKLLDSCDETIRIDQAMMNQIQR